MTLSIDVAARASDNVSMMEMLLLCELLKKSGFESDVLLARAGISPDSLRRPGARITRRQERDFHSIFASTTRDFPEIWIESGRRNRYSAWGHFGMANITAPTLRHVRRLAATRAGGVGRYPLVRPDPSNAGVAVRFDLDFAPGTDGFIFEVIREAIAGVVLFDELWGSTFPFAYIQVPTEAAYFGLSAFTDAPVRYCDGPLVFAWPIELDELDLPRGDELLHEQYLTMLDQAGKQSFPDKDGYQGDDTYEYVCQALSQMPDTDSSLSEIAAELGVSVRTLQRRIAARGIDFRSLRTEARLRRAQWMLRTSDASIGEIAMSVGYVEVSSFSHAFRRWAGESPRDYRLRGGGARNPLAVEAGVGA